MLQKRIIFSLLYKDGQYVQSRNFVTNSIGDTDWIIKNYNFENISKYIDELIILDISENKNMDNFLKSVEKKEIPIALLESVSVNLTDGTIVNINIKELLDEGNDPDILEKMLKTKLSALDYIIEDIDFYISVAAVQKAVQPATDELLKNL